MKTLLTGLAVCYLTLGQTQAQEKDVVRINAGDHALKNFPKDQRFLYQKYQPGKLYYHNGQALAGKFNVDILLGVLYGIGDSGDTLAIVNERRCQYVEIGGDVFYHSPKDEYVEILASNPYASLGVKEEFDFKRREKVIKNGSSSYVDPTNWAGTSWSSRRYVPPFVNPNYNILFHKASRFYFVDNDHNLHRACKSNMLVLFPQYRALLENFVKVKRTNFNYLEDLKDLFSFINGLNG